MSDKTEHTPGPWKVQWGRQGSYPLCVHTGAQNIVTAMARKSSPEAMANALLIAAAPDLLHELREILEWATKEKAPLRDQEIASIKLVIARATGARNA